MKLLPTPLVALATSFLATGAALAQQETGQATSEAQPSEQANAPAEKGDIRPVSITCQDIIDTDVELVPQLVYWIDGYNIAYDARTGEADIDPVVTVAENWLTVPANEVIAACEAEPERLASEVITEQKQKAESGSSN